MTAPDSAPPPEPEDSAPSFSLLTLAALTLLTLLFVLFSGHSAEGLTLDLLSAGGF